MTNYIDFLSFIGEYRDLIIGSLAWKNKLCWEMNFSTLVNGGTSRWINGCPFVGTLLKQLLQHISQK